MDDFVSYAPKRKNLVDSYGDLALVNAQILWRNVLLPETPSVSNIKSYHQSSSTEIFYIGHHGYLINTKPLQRRVKFWIAPISIYYVKKRFHIPKLCIKLAWSDCLHPLSSFSLLPVIPNLDLHFQIHIDCSNSHASSNCGR